VVPNTIIQTAWANPTLDDIAAALSTSIATDGQTPPTANLPMAGFRHTNVGPALAANQYARADQVQGFVFNIVSNVQNDSGRVTYTGSTPFGIGAGAVVIPTLMPLLFVPSANNGGPSTLALNGGSPHPILNSDATPLFADQITAGRPYALVYNGANWILITNTLDLSILNTQYLKLAGGTMGGALTLSQEPSTPLMAATKNYVDTSIAGSVAGVASFNTRTGAVTLLSSDVTNALSYTPANIAGSTFTGAISAPAISAPGGKVSASVFQLAAAGLGSIGALVIDCNTMQTIQISMTGNITLTVNNAVPGNIIRILLANTTGKTVTWPANTLWPMPVQTPPVIDSGTQKHCLVVMQWVGFLGSWFANASVY
jgi:hypothetical protein